MPIFRLYGAVVSTASVVIEAKDKEEAIAKVKAEDYNLENIDESDFSHFEWDGDESFITEENGTLKG